MEGLLQGKQVVAVLRQAAGEHGVERGSRMRQPCANATLGHVDEEAHQPVGIVEVDVLRGQLRARPRVVIVAEGQRYCTRAVIGLHKRGSFAGTAVHQLALIAERGLLGGQFTS